jgi:ribonucleoside-triphosphate reductase (thioredoxin)
MSEFDTMKDLHKQIFKLPSQEFVYYRTYSRWIESEKRREFYPESVDRYLAFLKNNLKTEKPVPGKVWNKIRAGMLDLSTMPSMRALWSAGPAAEYDNVTMYNCSFLVIDSWTSFAEVLYILMCGTGVGFSVESKYINKLPVIKQQSSGGAGVYSIEDSRRGWADALLFGIKTWANGQDIEFDYSSIRPKGARLKTMGGRSSGPEPLKKLLAFARETFIKAQGRQLTSIEVMDLVCEIAEIVVVGGVRRSSLICISDLGSTEIRFAKDFSKGAFPVRRYMANISAAYDVKPSAEEFMEEWLALVKSKSGERGIFNRYAAKKMMPARRNADLVLGTNPCGEILLRNMEFCNLSEVVVRPEDDFESLREKVATAVWLGAIQSSFTNFPYLRPEWKANCEEERLLGVSLTGQMDNVDLLSENNLKLLKGYAQKIAKHAAKILGINYSVSISTGKPSGTVSQLVNCGSGMHLWWSKWYIRRYRISAHDPLFKMLRDNGVPYYPEVGQDFGNASTYVLEFPVEAPQGVKTRHDMNALQQLEWYKRMVTSWAEHNQSATIYVKDNEWIDVAKWVYDNFDSINGVSFLPDNGGSYKLAPYEEITKEEYEKRIAMFPKIDYSMLSQYEEEDNTSGAKSYACVGGSCDVE